MISWRVDKIIISRNTLELWDTLEKVRDVRLLLVQFACMLPELSYTCFLVYLYDAASYTSIWGRPLLWITGLFVLLLT